MVLETMSEAIFLNSFRQFLKGTLSTLQSGLTFPPECQTIGEGPITSMGAT